MTHQLTKEQMAEQIRQKLTETILWLQQAVDLVSDDESARNDIESAIKDLEHMDLEVARAFRESGPQAQKE